MKNMEKPSKESKRVEIALVLVKAYRSKKCLKICKNGCHDKCDSRPKHKIPTNALGTSVAQEKHET